MNSLRERLGDVLGLGLIEVLVSMVLVSVGLLALAGSSLQVGQQNRLSASRTGESLAAQQAMEIVRSRGYATTTSGIGTVSIGNRAYRVTRAVTSPSPRIKVVRLTVMSRSAVSTPRVFTSRVYANRQLPTAP